MLRLVKISGIQFFGYGFKFRRETLKLLILFMFGNIFGNIIASCVKQLDAVIIDCVDIYFLYGGDMSRLAN